MTAGLPMLVVYKNCEHFRRTVPLLVMDETNPEDVDTDSEDHIYDEACHICMARPVGTVIGLLPQAGNKLAKAGKKEFFGRKAS